MKKNTSSYVFGGVLILLGIVFAGRALNIFRFNLFFDGWYTLFIIVPCFISLFRNNSDRSGSLIGLSIGILLLLSAQDFIQWRMFGPLLLAVIFIIVGCKMLIPKKVVKEEHFNFNEDGSNPNMTQSTEDTTQNANAFHGQQAYSQANYSYTYQNTQNAGQGFQGSDFQKEYQNTNKNTSNGMPFACTAVLSGRDLRFDNEVFPGAVLSAVLGAIELDLRNAIIRENVVIEAKTVLGGIDIYVPNYVKVVVNCTPILGGVDNKTMAPLNADEQTVTIYLNATCVLGGIDVK